MASLCKNDIEVIYFLLFLMIYLYVYGNYCKLFQGNINFLEGIVEDGGEKEKSALKKLFRDE